MIWINFLLSSQCPHHCTMVGERFIIVNWGEERLASTGPPPCREETVGLSGGTSPNLVSPPCSPPPLRVSSNISIDMFPIITGLLAADFWIKYCGHRSPDWVGSRLRDNGMKSVYSIEWFISFGSAGSREVSAGSPAASTLLWLTNGGRSINIICAL